MNKKYETIDIDISEYLNDFVDPRIRSILEEKITKYNNLCKNQPDGIDKRLWNKMKKEHYNKILNDMPFSAVYEDLSPVDALLKVSIKEDL